MHCNNGTSTSTSALLMLFFACFYFDTILSSQVRTLAAVRKYALIRLKLIFSFKHDTARPSLKTLSGQIFWAVS